MANEEEDAVLAGVQRIMSLEAAFSEMILSLPGGQSCDPQKVADTLREIAQRYGVTVP